MGNQIIHVLSIEDNPRDAELVRATLAEAAQLGWDLPTFVVERVPDLATGLVHLDAVAQGERHLDVVLTDLELPDSEPEETFVTLHRHSPNLPIVVLTGCQDEALARKTVRAGAEDYLFKQEISGSLLAHALIYALQRQGIKQALRRSRDELEARVERRTAELERVNAALRESEARFRVVFERAPLGVTRTSLDGRWLRVNQRFCEIVGYTREELYQMHYQDITHPEHLDADVKYARRLLAGDIPNFSLEKRYICKDDEIIWVNITVTLVRKPSGELDYFISVIEEITARKRAEAALQASEERLRALINATPDIICFKDGEGRWLEANRAHLQLFRLTDVDYHGKTDAELADYTAPRYREAFLECGRTDEHAWREGGLSRSEEVLPQPGGTRKVLDIIKAPIFEPDGRRKGLVVLGRDITARKEAEEALRESERKYRILVEQNQNGVFLIQDGRMQFVNSAFAEMLGYTVDEVVGMDFRDLVAPEDVDRVVDRYRRRQSGEEVPDTYAFRMLHKDGRRRVYVNMSVGLVTYHGRVASLGTVKDITERRQMEEQLRKQEQLAAVGQLAAGVAHDFRNLLTSIILYAQMGERRANVSPALQEDLGTIIEASHKATDLVQQLLDFSSHAMLERKPLEFGAFVEDVLRILRPAVPENIDLIYERGSEDYVVEVDPRRIQQVLINLALNARDALLAQGGGKLRFALEHLQIKPGESPPVADMPAGTWVRLTVSDTGTGMTDEVLEHLFEPFFTTKAVGEGTGLGLAQVYGIVRQHEGYIDVETAEGAGTTFYIYLPTSASEVQPVVEPDVSMPQGQGETILLVEDEPKLREVGLSVLESLGYRVLIARNGQEVVDKWLSRPVFEDIDLVITDLVMPEMGGRELVRVLHERKPSLKVLAVTGYAVGEVLEDLRRLGFWEVLRKPFEMSGLAEAVSRALQARD